VITVEPDLGFDRVYSLFEAARNDDVAAWLDVAPPARRMSRTDQRKTATVVINDATIQFAVPGHPGHGTMLSIEDLKDAELRQACASVADAAWVDISVDPSVAMSTVSRIAAALRQAGAMYMHFNLEPPQGD
jgi:hypothetical protein